MKLMLSSVLAKKGCIIKLAVTVFISAMCLCGCSETMKLPVVNDYFSTELAVKTSVSAGIMVDKLDLSEINGIELSEYGLLAFYDNKLYLTQEAVAENTFEKQKVVGIIEYDTRTGATTIVAESSLPSLLSDEENAETTIKDDFIFVNYRDMGYYENKLFFAKISSYASAGALVEYYFYDMATGECELFFTPVVSATNRTLRIRHGELAFLNGKVYFDELRYGDDGNDYSADVYSYDIKTKAVILEKNLRRRPLLTMIKYSVTAKMGFIRSKETNMSFPPMTQIPLMFQASLVERF